MATDDNFEPYWLNEDDWLVTICPLPKDEDHPEVNLETLIWIGRLFGFATATNTRMLALNYSTWFASGGVQLPSRIEGGVVVGQYKA